MVPGALLLEKLLQPEEQIENMNIRWHYPAMNQLVLVASTEVDPLYIHRQKLQMSASFQTSQGRTLYLYGFPNNRRVNSIAPSNPLPLKMLPRDSECIYDLASAHYEMQIKNPGEELLEKLRSGSLPLEISTYLDVIADGVFVLSKKDPVEGVLGTSLLGEFKDLKFPSGEELSAPGSSLRLKFLRDRAKRSPHGFLLMPVSIQFIGLDEESVHSGECTVVFRTDNDKANRYLLACARKQGKY